MIRAVIFLCTLLWASVVIAADAPQVVISAGQVPAMYSVGKYEGDAILLPAMSNRLAASLDRSQMVPGTEGLTVRVICEVFDGVIWVSPGCGAFTTTGGELHDPRIPGNPIVNASLFTTSLVPSIVQEQIRIVYEITGGDIVTSSAVQMWEVK